MRQLCYAVCVLLLLASCQYKVICPTFQSTYILDDSARTAYFSYVWYLNEGDRQDYLASQEADTTTYPHAISDNCCNYHNSQKLVANWKNSSALPPDSTQVPAPVLPPDSLGVLTASASNDRYDYYEYVRDYKVRPIVRKKDKYGMVKRVPYLLRLWQFKTSPMQNVYTPIGSRPEKKEDVLDLTQAQRDSIALAGLDSIALADSARVQEALAAAQLDETRAPKWIYEFDPMKGLQPDQEQYFQYYGWMLQNMAPNPKPVPIKGQTPTQNLNDSTATEKKPFFQRVKGIFKKKDKAPKPEEEVPEEEPEPNSEAVENKEEKGGQN